MAQYTVSSGDVTGASTKTIVSVLAAAAKMPRLKQLIIGCTGAPADATAIFAVRLITADGTGTAATPKAANAAVGASSCTAKVNYTIEPTYGTGNIARIPLNQRVTAIWNAPFDGEYWSNLSGGTNVGLGVQMVSGPALAYEVTAVFDE